MRRMAIVLISTLVAGVVAAQDHLTPSQLAARSYALRVGGRTLAAIIAQESSYCRDKLGDDGRSLGCGQLQLRTARLFTDATRRRLIHDDRYNIALAARYLQHCIFLMGSWRRGVYCYNHGPQAARRATWEVLLSDAYVRAVQRRLRRLQHTVQ